MSETFSADLQDFELPETESEVRVDINNNDIYVPNKNSMDETSLDEDEKESPLPLNLAPQIESKTESVVEEQEEEELDKIEKTLLPESNELVVDEMIENDQKMDEICKEEDMKVGKKENLEETDIIEEDDEHDDDEVGQEQEENFEDNETSIERWNSLKKRTLEMKNVALSCSTFLHPEYKVIERLDDIYKFMESKGNHPGSSNFKDDIRIVDERMQHVNELVGKAIDNYLGNTKVECKSVCRHFCGMWKTIAVFVGVVIFAFVIGEFVV